MLGEPADINRDGFYEGLERGYVARFRFFRN